jgi:hypothetical protein
MFKITVGLIVAVGFAASSFAPLAVAAKESGARHFAKSASFKHAPVRRHYRIVAHRRYDDGFLGYGYYLADDDFIAPIGGDFPPLRLDPVIPPPGGLTCTRSRETVTVPREDGGTQQITITRC